MFHIHVHVLQACIKDACMVSGVAASSYAEHSLHTFVFFNATKFAVMVYSILKTNEPMMCCFVACDMRITLYAHYMYMYVV